VDNYYDLLTMVQVQN